MSHAAFLILALLPGAGRGEPPVAVPPGLANVELAERAEAEFRLGVEQRGDAEKARPHFRTAAAYFDELRRRGARNALLYRNLGNADLLADDLPHAILSYRRGLALAPYDRSLRDNLEQARALVVYPAGTALGRPPVENRPPWLPRLRSEWAFAAAAAFYVLTWALLTRWLMARRGALLAGGLMALALAGVATALLIVDLRGERGRGTEALVVIAEDGVLLRKGNGLAFPPRYEAPLNRGVEARLLFERGDWLQIELAGGEVGWVPRAYTLVDEAPPG